MEENQSKKQTSVIIDGIFLAKAVRQTQKTYAEIYPEKKFEEAELNFVIDNILTAYNKFDTPGETIECYLYVDEILNLDNIVSVDVTNNGFSTQNGNRVELIIVETGDFVAWDAMDKMKSLAEKKNIILVANDRMYEPLLEDLYRANANVNIVTLDSSNGGRISSKFRWGNILYPLGKSFNLTDGEL
jgi:hypothetical protein